MRIWLCILNLWTVNLPVYGWEEKKLLNSSTTWMLYIGRLCQVCKKFRFQWNGEHILHKVMRIFLSFLFFWFLIQRIIFRFTGSCRATFVILCNDNLLLSSMCVNSSEKIVKYCRLISFSLNTCSQQEWSVNYIVIAL